MARGAESVVYEAILDGTNVAVKKPTLSTSDDLDKFHKELQILWLFFFLMIFIGKTPVYGKSILHIVLS